MAKEHKHEETKPETKAVLRTQADPKGTVVEVSPNSITMTHDDGSPEWRHGVADTATVTLNGKPAKLLELLVGDHVELSGKPATSVVATRS